MVMGEQFIEIEIICMVVIFLIKRKGGMLELLLEWLLWDQILISSYTLRFPVYSCKSGFQL